MIVVCTNCRAKFRVADEKIGPRGAKVRCSRCRTAIVVHPQVGTDEAAVAPPFPPAPPAPFSLDDPFASGPVRSPVPAPGAATVAIPPAMPPPLPPARAQAADPFGGTSDDLAPPPAPDPFGTSGAVVSPPALGPFSGAPDAFASFPPATEPLDPFGPLGGDSGEGGPGLPLTDGGPGLPLTDVSDLLGSAAAAAPPPTAMPTLAEPTGGLALEDRLTPPPTRVGGVAGLFDDLEVGHQPPADPFAGPEGRALDAASFGGDPFAGADALALASEPEPAPEPAPALPEETAPPPGEATAAAAPETTTASPPPAHRGTRLRSIALNAVALGALLSMALAILVVWRSEGPIQVASLRPAAIAAALRSGRSAALFAAADVRSGEYERQEGPPVLFVRGDVVSRALRPVAALEVAVEIVRDGQVLARGAALAGGVPTPEELWRAKDAAALAELARAGSGRAARGVGPGDRVPFLVPIYERPADLLGASLRVEVQPAQARGR